jgi:hypothetical protein
VITLEELVGTLKRALHDPEYLETGIRTFMITVDAADDDELVMTDGQKVILRDVAFDLAFFVADPEWRAEDPSYYGPERARSEIENALERLGS